VLRVIQRILEQLFTKRLHIEVRADGERFVVRSHGLNEYKLPEIEIADCPERLTEVARNLVLQTARNSKNTPESLQAGKTIAAKFVRSDQSLIEAFRFVHAGTEARDLRIVDLQDGHGTFPNHLVATHLCATAGVRPNEALRLLFVAIELWPMEKTASNTALGDYEYNPNNFWSWIELGTVLFKAGRTEDAITHWKTGVCMWPRGGKFYGARMLAKKSHAEWDAGRRPLQDGFWSSVTNDSIGEWCRALAVTIPEAALKD
jgi:hypothetical protein